MLVISPHLDDGVFSCGQILAAQPGATIITVLAGVPSVSQPLTDWDRNTMGPLASSAEAVLARRKEDTAACELLGATPIWLDGLDQQYTRPPGHDQDLAMQLTAVLREQADDRVLIPLGIKHADHELVSGMARAVAYSLDRPFSIYEELPYRVASPDALAVARRRAWEEGWELKPISLPRGSIETKDAAVESYATQFGQFPREDLRAVEQIFTAKPRGDRPPDRWPL